MRLERLNMELTARALAQHMFATYIDAVLRLAKPDFELYVFGDDLMTAVIYPVLYIKLIRAL